MLFNSVVFLFAFLPITYLGFWGLRSTRARHLWFPGAGDAWTRVALMPCALARCPAPFHHNFR